MDMDQAAVFLAGSILIMLGFIVVASGVIVINNLISKYWKPVRIFTMDSWNLNPPIQYTNSQETLETTNKKSTKHE
jgi:hypothetical protein